MQRSGANDCICIWGASGSYACPGRASKKADAAGGGQGGKAGEGGKKKCDVAAKVAASQSRTTPGFFETL